ncbi:MAG: ABC transporter ATP-binding protein [Spirochaetales bacterium]|nr:ABC transporter ATP-binding protein [Spirochaetales bacterium]
MLDLRELHISIDKKKILSGISAKALPGQLTLLLGDNGAGKTTLFNALTGRLEYESGEVYYNSELKSLEDEKYVNRISFIRNEGGTLPLLTIEEQLILKCRLYGVKNSEIKDRIENVITLFDLEKHRHYRSEELSSGFRKKLGIAMALVTDADIYLFDEPFNSLDHKSTTALVQIIDLLKTRGKIIILSTHTPSIIEKQTDRLWYLSASKIRESSDKEKITKFINNISSKKDGISEMLKWIK